MARPRGLSRCWWPSRCATRDSSRWRSRRSRAVSSRPRSPCLGRQSRSSQRDVVIFTRQFATMVNSGLSLIKALSVLVEQTDSQALADVLAEVKVDVEQGTSLSGALEKHPKVFSPI